MKNYLSADELMNDLRAALLADDANPVAQYALTLSSSSKSLLSKYSRCPKLKVESFSKILPVWQGTIQFANETIELGRLLDQLQALTIS